MNCWCKVVDYDPETNTYDVMTEYKSRFHKVPEHAIYDKRTKQQRHKIRIKKLEI